MRLLIVRWVNPLMQRCLRLNYKTLSCVASGALKKKKLSGQALLNGCKNRMAKSPNKKFRTLLKPIRFRLRRLKLDLHLRAKYKLLWKTSLAKTSQGKKLLSI